MKLLVAIIALSLLAAYGAPEERRCRVVSNKAGSKGMICVIQPRYRHWIDGVTVLFK